MSSIDQSFLDTPAAIAGEQLSRVDASRVVIHVMQSNRVNMVARSRVKIIFAV